MAEPRKRESGVSTKVLKYFTQRTGEVVFIGDMREYLGLRDSQITSAIHHLTTRGRKNVRADIRTVTAGTSWQYHGMVENEPEKPDQSRTDHARMFEEIGTTRDGSLIIQATDGGLWRATEL